MVGASDKDLPIFRDKKMKTKKNYFDNSIMNFVSIILKVFDTNFLEENIILRDANGRLTLILKNENYDSLKLASLQETLESEMTPYIEPGYTICTAKDIYDTELDELRLDDKTRRNIEIGDKNISYHFFERRIIGGDWQRYYSEYTGPVRIVFSSIKGGVGRSTALCVAASYLARSGKRVLAIDLDLEAPGIGNMLLTNETLPKFGLIDYFLEKNLGNVDTDFVEDMIGSSWLSYGKGRIDIIPAIGSSSFSHPENVLSKLSRAYLPSSDVSGHQLTFMDSLRELIDNIDSKRYDVILIDSRAGLHETSAAALVGLGAEVFCFGVDQPQTFQGYELLFSAINNNYYANHSPVNWIERLQFVHAKASIDKIKQYHFNEKISNLIRGYFTDDNNNVSTSFEIEELKDTFEVGWDEDLYNDEINKIVSDESTDYPRLSNVIAILNDERYDEFDPLSDKSSLNEDVYNVTFGSLVSRVREIVDESLSDRYERG